MVLSAVGDRSAVLVLLACCAVVSTPARAERASPEAPAIAARELRGGGGWERDQGVARGGAVQRWDIDVRRGDDGVLSGAVVLRGSELMQRGTVRGRIDGRRVTGRISDESGNYIADFAGTVRPDGSLRGSWQDRSGEVGRWSWDGPPPQ